MALTPCSRRIVVRLYQVDRPCVPWRVRSKNPTRPRAVPPGSTKDVEDRGNVSQWEKEEPTGGASPFQPIQLRERDAVQKFGKTKKTLSVL